ncbi:hypothetical protein TNCV_3965221 [Trichonephila clavipes]|nr:hypothetical protein TNCV_3965221 [Trichonephila clavipes]
MYGVPRYVTCGFVILGGAMIQRVQFRQHTMHSGKRYSPDKRQIQTLPFNRFIEWAQNEIAVVTDFHKRILLSDEAHFWLNGYVNKQNCRIWREANPQVYVEKPKPEN